LTTSSPAPVVGAALIGLDLVGASVAAAQRLRGAFTTASPRAACGPAGDSMTEAGAKRPGDECWPEENPEPRGLRERAEGRAQL
jgi:hypothetical protein